MRFAFAIHGFAITILHFTSIKDYFETVIYSQILIVICVIIGLTSLMLDYKKNRSSESVNILKMFKILIIFVIFEIINFSFSFYEYYHYIFRWVLSSSVHTYLLNM